MPAVAVQVRYRSCYIRSIVSSALVMRYSFYRQRFCAEVCTDGFIINACHSFAALLAAKALHIFGVRYKALLRQHCRTIHILQQRKAALRPHLRVGILHQLLLVVFQIINVPHSPTSAQFCADALHSTGQQSGKIKALLMPCTSGNCRIALKPGCRRAIGCGVAVDGQQ